MRDKDLDTGNSWPLAFFTTSICFFVFVVFLKFIDDRFPVFFLRTAIACFILGCLSLLKSPRI